MAMLSPRATLSLKRAILACTCGLVNFNPSRRACSVGVRTSEISMCLLLLSCRRDDGQAARTIVGGQAVVETPVEGQVISVRREMVTVSRRRCLERQEIELRWIAPLVNDQI